jgi:hypothetical protein
MAGLVPAMPIDMARSRIKNRDRRDKPGDDVERLEQSSWKPL